MKVFNYLIAIIVLTQLVSCNQKEDKNQKSDCFVLTGKVTDHENLYLKISYDDKIDSALVKNGKFLFEGKLTQPASLTFLSKKAMASKRQMYLENSTIHVNLTLEKKVINPDLIIDWFVLKDSNGSETDLRFTEFVEFKTKNQANLNWNEQLYAKLEKMFRKYPSNQLSADLLFDETLESTLTNEELRKLYALIDWESQDDFRRYKTTLNIMPERYEEIGKEIQGFTLSNDKGIAVSTTDYRGEYVLIDFWASWCVPCIEEFPALKSIYSQYENKGFNILTVSIDATDDVWLKAVKKYDTEWDNVISKEGLESDIMKTFNLYAIPSNYLVDKNGVVVAKDIHPEELEIFLKENI